MESQRAKLSKCFRLLVFQLKKEYNVHIGGAWCSGSTRASDSLSVGSIPIAPARKNDKFRLVVFLSKPQAWYGITRKRVWYRRRRMASPKVHFLRLDSIPSCNGFHTMLCIDSIHASRRDVAHEFNSIRKLLKISFLSALHKTQAKHCLRSFYSHLREQKV